MFRHKLSNAEGTNNFVDEKRSIEEDDEDWWGTTQRQWIGEIQNYFLTLS